MILTHEVGINVYNLHICTYNIFTNVVINFIINYILMCRELIFDCLYMNLTVAWRNRRSVAKNAWFVYGPAPYGGQHIVCYGDHSMDWT